MYVDRVLIFERFRCMLDNVYIHLFLIVVLTDLVTARKTADLITSHLCILFVLLVVYPYLELVGFEAVGNSFVLFFVGTYGLSIVKNLEDRGVPLPKKVSQMLESLTKEEEDD